MTNFRRWADEKPVEMKRGQLLLWRTAHVRLKSKMTMSGQLRQMHNGWHNTDHILPPMTRWDGYQHIIPKDLEWSDDVPEWIASNATVNGKSGPVTIEHRLVRLLSVEGVEPSPCPFCGAQAKWETRDGFIGAMPHQQNEFSIGHCLRTGFYQTPEAAVKLWNSRPEVT